MKRAVSTLIAFVVLANAAHAQSGPTRAEFSDVAGLGAMALDQMLGALNIKPGISASDALGLYESFTDLDETYEPDLDPEGMPQVPSHCVEASGDCEACYGEAYGKLNRARFNLERLRGIYRETKDYVDWAVSFGDTVSPIHGLSGLAWQAEKTKILRSLEGLNKTYDTKYEELLEAVKESLTDVAQCEQEHFGESDWYNRFGFIYYSFISERYRRAD